MTVEVNDSSLKLETGIDYLHQDRLLNFGIFHSCTYYQKIKNWFERATAYGLLLSHCSIAVGVFNFSE